MRAAVVVFAALSACATAPPRPSASKHEKARSPSTSIAKTPLDSRLEAKLAEQGRLHDWRSSIFGTGAVNPPNAKRATIVEGQGGRLSERVVTIRAYHFLDDFRARGSSRRSNVEEPRNLFPFVDDGRLDSRVVPPESTLTVAETGDILRLLKVADLTYDDSTPRAFDSAARFDVWPPMRYLDDSAPPSFDQRPHKALRARMRCAFEPHHVLVLFDDADRPVGKIFVCFECGEIVSTPRSPELGGAHPGMMTDEEKVVVRRIFDAHRLGAWTYGETPELKELAEYEQRIYGAPDEPTPLGERRLTERNARPSGVPKDVTPAQATPHDRERLCVWLREAMSERNRQTHSGVVGAFECAGSGPNYRFALDEGASCESRQLCDVPLGRIEACLLGTVLLGVDEVCASGVPPECTDLMHCLPYLDWRPDRATRARR